MGLFAKFYKTVVRKGKFTLDLVHSSAEFPPPAPAPPGWRLAACSQGGTEVISKGRRDLLTRMGHDPVGKGPVGTCLSRKKAMSTCLCASCRIKGSGGFREITLHATIQPDAREGVMGVVAFLSGRVGGTPSFSGILSEKRFLALGMLVRIPATCRKSS